MDRHRSWKQSSNTTTGFAHGNRPGGARKRGGGVTCLTNWSRMTSFAAHVSNPFWFWRGPLILVVWKGGGWAAAAQAVNARLATRASACRIARPVLAARAPAWSCACIRGHVQTLHGGYGPQRGQLTEVHSAPEVTGVAHGGWGSRRSELSVSPLAVECRANGGCPTRTFGTALSGTTKHVQTHAQLSAPLLVKA